MLDQMHARDDAPTRALAAKGDFLLAGVFDKRQIAFLIESLDGRSRCYVARPGGEAARVAWADVCTVSLDGSTVILEASYTDETTLSAMDVQGGRETVLLDDVEGVESYEIAPNGSQVAYLRVTAEGEQVLRVERRGGEAVAVSDVVVEVLEYGFAPDGDLLLSVVREEDEGAVQLYLSSGNRPRASGDAIDARFTPDGAHVVYLVREGETGTLHVDPLGEGEARVVLSGAGVSEVTIVHTAPPRLVIPVTQGEGIAIHTAGLDGTDVVQVLQEAYAALRGLWYVEGEPALYVLLEREDAGMVLYAVPLDGGEAVPLLEGWHAVEILNRSPRGERLAFAGQQTPADPSVLYAIDVAAGAVAVVLDDVHVGFENAVFTDRGRSVLYTGLLAGEAGETDVCRVPAAGNATFEVLYERARLVDVRWDRLNPFVRP
jgi:dipeptidyl aminopeptidase/acylaminoacyl peptidase